MCLFWLNCLFTEYTVRVLLFSTALTFWSLWLFDPADASGGLLISWKKKKTTSSFLTKDVLFQKICSWNPTKAWWQGKSRISDQVLNPGNRGFSYLRSFYDLINFKSFQKSLTDFKSKFWFGWKKLKHKSGMCAVYCKMDFPLAYLSNCEPCPLFFMFQLG